MDNLRSLKTPFGSTHQTEELDPLEEIMLFYEQAGQVEDEPQERPVILPEKINFLEECFKLVSSIEKAQKRTDFYLDEVLGHIDQN